ncbi:porin [Rugamonas rubra]|uniref:Porin n=1 Tax=Rugamonas rubra TaxID=758825 RepID=A0A1I4NEU4_9BURK|nr:porin [Rugamonas rubra]SFM14072.1 porin [Rugamonas rubra]
MKSHYLACGLLAPAFACAQNSAAPPLYGLLDANWADYTVPRHDNAIAWQTARLRGISASAIYSLGEAPGNDARNRIHTATLGYARGWFNVSLSHQRRSGPVDAVATLPAADLSAQSSLLAANLRLGRATMYAAYGHNHGDGHQPWDSGNPYGALAFSTPASNSRDLLFGLAVPFGRTTLLASVIHRADHTLLNQDARQLALGMSYSLSRRTDFYASVARVRYQNSGYGVLGNGLGLGVAPGPGPGAMPRADRALNIGLRYGF